MAASSSNSDRYISPQQLCLGLHIHLDLPWTAHPFTFSSFKIRDLTQIATIQSLGLPRVRYTPETSDSQPLALAPEERAEPSPAPVEAAPLDTSQATQAKRDRMQRLSAQRARAAACEKELLSAAKTIRAINQNLFSQPEVVHEQASALMQTIAGSMLVDADVSIQLMADKIGREDVYFHSLNVVLLSMMLAKELKAPMEALHRVGLAALFHDVGEAEIPDRVVRKTEPLTRAEAALFQQHCRYGVEIGKKLKLPPEVLTVVAQHHERVDGSGYPEGLTGERMSLLSRIVALVNAYDELCNPHHGQRPLTPHEALSTLYAQQRAQFDPLVMTTFIRCMGVYPPGTLVVLSNGAVGMVVSVNCTRPLKPTVLVHDPAVPRDEAILVDLELEPDVTVARTLKPEQLSDEAHAYLSPRKRVTYYFDAETPHGP